MKHKIKAAFDEVKAEHDLKEKTEAFVLRHLATEKPTRKAYYQPVLAALACLILVLTGGFWSVFTPTAQITIDINPSVVLGVNRFDRVISLDSYNPDGDALIHSLDVKFLPYSDAVDQIMTSETISALLSEDEIMTIAVTGQNAQQSEKIYSNIQSCTDDQNRVYCYYAESEEAAQAHHMGLSHPRYQAYLILQEQGQSVDAEDLNGMTMKEIRDLIGESSAETTCEPHQNDSGNGNHHGQETTGHNESDNGNHHVQESTDQNVSGNGNHHSQQTTGHNESGNGNQHGHSYGKQHH